MADNGKPTGMVFLEESPPFPEPAGPTDGEPTPNQDTDFIMDTLFGEQPPVPSAQPKSGEGQAQGSTSPDGQSQGTSPAPSAAAPAAKGGESSPQPEPSPTPAAPTPTQAEPAAGGAATQTPARGTETPAAPAPSAQPELSVEDRMRLASATALAQQNQQLLARLQALESGQPAPGQTTSPQAPPAPDQSAEPIRLTVPQNLYEALNHEDFAVAKPALDTLVSAVATNAVQAALTRVNQVLDGRFQQWDQRAEQTRQVVSQEEAYYGRHPAHKNPLYRPVIQATVAELYNELPGLQWDETTMDAVGARVNNKLKALGITVGMVPGTVPVESGTAPHKGNGAPPKPAPMLDTSTRPSGTPADGSDFIRDTFGG